MFDLKAPPLPSYFFSLFRVTFLRSVNRQLVILLLVRSSRVMELLCLQSGRIPCCLSFSGIFSLLCKIIGLLSEADVWGHQKLTPLNSPMHASNSCLASEPKTICSKGLNSTMRRWSIWEHRRFMDFSPDKGTLMAALDVHAWVLQLWRSYKMPVTVSPTWGLPGE